jgi:exodeoxyribonuclease V
MPIVLRPQCSEPEAAQLNDDQLAAFVKITRLLQEGQQVIKMSGQGGTGKTHLLVRLVEWAMRSDYNVSIAAPTHKAAGVIAEKFRNDDILKEVDTIQSLLGLLLTPDMEDDTGEKVLRTNPESKKKGDRMSGDKNLICVDESSMLSAQLKWHIEANTHDGIQWLFVGDLAQLPPVGESISQMLQNPDVQLHQIVRQSRGSEIIRLATKIRQGDLSMVFSSGKDVQEVESAAELLQKALERFDTEEYRNDPSHARMLVFRNARRKEYNDACRSLLVSKPDPYVEDEWLVTLEQFVPDRSKLNQLAEAARKFRKGDDGYRSAWRAFFELKEWMEQQGTALDALHTSSEVRVRRVEEGVMECCGNTFDIWWLAVLTKNNDLYNLPVLKENSQLLHQDAVNCAKLKAQALRKVMNEMEDKGSNEWWELDRQRKLEWREYFSLQETFAAVDYSFAMTVHRSQGSTFTHALVDVADLMSSNIQKTLLYTACTRPSKTLTFYK